MWLVLYTSVKVQPAAFIKLAEFAKESGYDMILDQAACGYVKPTFDVTDLILKKMGVKTPKK